MIRIFILSIICITRLVNHCKFWEAWFTWALKNKLANIDVRSTASPIKIYGNGFTLKPLKELPRRWINVFYDEQDCIKANAIIEKIIRTKDITWVQTDHKFKMFISAFQQLQVFLKEFGTSS